MLPYEVSLEKEKTDKSKSTMVNKLFISNSQMYGTQNNVLVLYGHSL